MNEYDDILNFILKHEGGYINDPDDPGGETKYGISKKAHPDADINDLTIEQAKEIYYRSYLTPVLFTINFKCGVKEDHTLLLTITDAAVQHGHFTAYKLLQQALISFGAGIKKDGIIGPNTAKALSTCIEERGIKDICIMMIHHRINLYISLKQRKFLAGWMKRSNDLIYDVLHNH